MGLLFSDGMDMYSAVTDLNRKGWYIDTSRATLATTNGRGGRQYIRITGHTFEDLTTGLVRNFPTLITSGQTVYCSFWVYFEQAAAGMTFFSFMGGPDNWEQFCLLKIAGSSFLVVYRGANNGTFLGYSTVPTTLGQWYHFEVAAMPHASTGIIQLRIDGVLAFDFTGNTCGNATKEFSGVYFGGTATNGANGATYYDDILIWDTSTAGKTKFHSAGMGPLNIQTIIPNGDSAVQFTRSAGATNASCVDDSPAPNSDTDYVESSTVGDKDLYTLSDLTHIPTTTKGVVINTVAKKSDAGARKIKLKVKVSGGSENSPNTEYALGSGYDTQQLYVAVKPGSGSPSFSGTDINNLIAGMVISG